MTLLRSYRKLVSELRNKTRSPGCRPWPFAARFSFLFKMHWCFQPDSILLHELQYPFSMLPHSEIEEPVIIAVLWLGTLQEVYKKWSKLNLKPARFPASSFKYLSAPRVGFSKSSVYGSFIADFNRNKVRPALRPSDSLTRLPCLLRLRVLCLPPQHLSKPWVRAVDIHVSCMVDEAATFLLRGPHAVCFLGQKMQFGDFCTAISFPWTTAGLADELVWPG